jgi:hypothetical protein
MTEDLDRDLETLSRDALLSEAKRLRRAIRKHRDSIGHALCWHHPDMWDLLPDKLSIEITVPDWPQFMRGCIRYRSSLDEQLPNARRTRREFGDAGRE